MFGFATKRDLQKVCKHKDGWDSIKFDRKWAVARFECRACKGIVNVHGTFAVGMHVMAGKKLLEENGYEIQD